MVDTSSHPLVIVLWLFTFVILGATVFLVLRLVIPGLATLIPIYANNPQAYTLANNGNYIVTGLSTFGDSVWNYGTIVIVLIALIVDTYIAWRHPHHGMGMINLIMIFILPMVYLALKVGLQAFFASGFITASGFSAPYYFFVSIYFIVICEVFLIINTIGNFRPINTFNDGGAGYNGYYGNIRDFGDTRD